MRAVEEGFHVHVDVLVVIGELVFPGLHIGQDAQKALRDGGGVCRGEEDALCPQHLGVGQRAGDVLPVQPLIEADRGVELIYKGVRVLFEPPGP